MEEIYQELVQLKLKVEALERQINQPMYGAGIPDPDDD